MTEDDEVRAYYDSGAEADRLGEPLGVVELERTKEILARDLPPPPATIADIGGGPGRYAIWLAGLGYEVFHRDLIPLHVEQTRAAAASANVHVDARVADARSLDLPDAGADAVLLLGPLYHLNRRADRVRSLREARRVARPGAHVFAAAISRWALRFHGILVERISDAYPEALSLVDEVERTGVFPPLFEGSFVGFSHRPPQLRAEARSAGLEIVDLVNVEGISFALPDLEARAANERDRHIVLESARAVERVPELLGLGPHLLLTARVP